MWYVAIGKNVVPRAELSGTEGENLAWMKKHHEAGNVLFSGPTTEGPGIWVVRAENRDAAKTLLDSHPWVAAGKRTYEMYEWRVQQALGVGRFEGPPSDPVLQNRP